STLLCSSTSAKLKLKGEISACNLTMKAFFFSGEIPPKEQPASQPSSARMLILRAGLPGVLLSLYGSSRKGTAAFLHINTDASLVLSWDTEEQCERIRVLKGYISRSTTSKNIQPSVVGDGSSLLVDINISIPFIEKHPAKEILTDASTHLPDHQR
ncbi:Hypothetical predicted protein, partial [Podarcis lilfordi]